MTYYVPFPLSIIHPQQPIIQAALLSTYFDNPCGDPCPYGANIASPAPKSYFGATSREDSASATPFTPELRDVPSSQSSTSSQKELLDLAFEGSGHEVKSEESAGEISFSTLEEASTIEASGDGSVPDLQDPLVDEVTTAVRVEMSGDGEGESGSGTAPIECQPGSRDSTMLNQQDSPSIPQLDEIEARDEYLDQTVTAEDASTTTENDVQENHIDEGDDDSSIPWRIFKFFWGSRVVESKKNEIVNRIMNATSDNENEQAPFLRPPPFQIGRAHV